MKAVYRLLANLPSWFYVGMTLLIPTLMMVAASGCSRGHTEEKSAESEKGPPVATIGKVERKTLKRNVEQPGFIMSYETTPIYTRIPGYVLKIASRPSSVSGDAQIDMGDEVKSGQVLATLFVPEMEDDVKLKHAMVAQSRAELLQNEAALKTAIANVKTNVAMIGEEESVRIRANANVIRWKSEYQRDAKLVAEGTLDKQVAEEALKQWKGAEGFYEEVNAKVLRAEAARDESIAKKFKAEADVALAKVRIDVSIANEKLAQSWCDYRDIRAPYDGVIMQRNVHTGHLVKPAQGGEKGESLFLMLRMDKMRIFVDVPEADAIYVEKGHRAVIRIQAQQNREIEATVTRISWALDQTTRTLRAEIELPNQDRALRPGMYAYAYIPIEYKDVWTLPATAIVHTEEEGAFVMREEAGKAVLTPVRLGARVGAEQQVTEYLCKKCADPVADRAWQRFAGTERIIMNPELFKDGQTIDHVANSN